ncbi:MAG: M1 family metallopeptidase, partial [Sandaracinaceae bacterium]|nr:M1 family metallopeptidase [Sandaracinaceae bacterium]
ARRIVLHGQGLEVGEARAVAGSRTVSARWRVLDADRGVAAVELDEEIGPGQVTLRIAYSAPFDRTLEGLYRVQVQDDWYAFSQMEPLAARKAFPCFDEPAFKAPFDVTLAIPSGMRAIGNGPEAESVTEGERLRVRFERTPPLPSYLVAFAVGPLDIVEATSIAPNDVRARPLPLRGVATRGQGPRLAHALRHTPTIVAALERWFGIEYPYAKLDLIAVPDFGAGAMENAGAITFRERLLLLGEDPPIAQQRAFAFVTAHELAHHWFGNLVTTAWWDDLWLNEAFATWMETHALEQDFPELRAEIAEVEVFADAIGADSLATARRIREPIASDHDVHNAFDDITYGKGASILAMFEAYLGEDVFRRGVQSYLRSHEHGTAAAGDLLAALDRAAGRDVATAFATFLDQSGTPFVRVEASCEEGRPRLTLAQSRYLPLGSHAEAERVWQVPVCVRYQLGGQSGGELRRACTLLDRPQGELALEGCPDWVMPNADGIGYYVWSLPAPQLEALRTRGMARLSAREQLAVAQNVRQAERAGGIAYADALALLVPLASSTERELATSAMGLLERGIDRLVDASERD